MNTLFSLTEKTEDAKLPIAEIIDRNKSGVTLMGTYFKHVQLDSDQSVLWICLKALLAEMSSSRYTTILKEDAAQTHFLWPSYEALKIKIRLKSLLDFHQAV